MPWIQGEFSPPSVPGKRLPACEGDLGKDKSATAQSREVQGITMFFTGAPARFNIAGEYTASGRNQIYPREGTANISVFVVVITCNVNTSSK